MSRPLLPVLAVLAVLAAACDGNGSSLAVDAPATADAPRIDARIVDAPIVDAPGIDAPGIDAPGIDAPAIDAPAIDAPAIDAPAIDAPTIDAPTIDAPAIDAPGIDASASAITTACTRACDAIAVCAMETDAGCVGGCSVDLADCTAQQVQQVEACATEACGGDIKNSPLFS